MKSGGPLREFVARLGEIEEWIDQCPACADDEERRLAARQAMLDSNGGNPLPSRWPVRTQARLPAMVGQTDTGEGAGERVEPSACGDRAGSQAGLSRHRRAGERECGECRAFRSSYNRTARHRRLYRQAQERLLER